MEIDGKSRICVVTPTLSLTAYADGDQVGGVLELVNAVSSSSSTGAVMSITVLDKDKQDQALDILFFNSSPTIASVDNAALDITDAEMASKFLGAVRIAATDYKDLAASSVATVRVVGLMLQALHGANNSTGTSIYAVIQARGTPTYTASGLVLKIGVVQD